MNDTDEQNRPVWCAVDPGSMVWADWGEDHAVYHRPSGRTHFLNETSRLLIVHVLPAPGTPGADAATVAAALDLAGDEGDPATATEEIAPEITEEIRDLLMHLEALGLVERVTRPA